ncbi:MAG: CBS domain-containing protein [Bacteroidales bacterium]|nr:CBS domain-containing protein [Bacteroidales bacterium]
MLAKDLISEVVPALKTSDTGLQALAWMDIFRISHLPIVNNQEFLGLISDKDIYNLNMAEEAIGNHKLSLFSPYILLSQHIYEVIEIVSRLKLTVVPVLDEQKNYQGLITLNDLLQSFANLSALKHPGGIIELELNVNDYTLTEISQIVESNDAKILSMYVSSPEDSMQMTITLKVNTTDITSIIQTFNRYDYTVKASYMESGELEDLLHNRYEAFMKFLNI